LDDGNLATLNGRNVEDKAAVEEVERFDDISIVGLLDEEKIRERKHALLLSGQHIIKRKGKAERKTAGYLNWRKFARSFTYFLFCIMYRI
jgi:hypothetical protein